MELDLNKIDYVQIGITGPYSLALLPVADGEKQKQKVVIASIDGHLITFSVKKNDINVHFKTLVGPSIASIRLGGSPGAVQDKIFVASENRVAGFSKKGKQFLAFETNMTESIKCMFVSGSDLMVCGNHVFNQYKDCKDNGSYLCGDTIVDIATIRLPGTGRIIVALACSGRVLRLLEYCRVRQSLELESIPTVLHVSSDATNKLYCGFADGTVQVLHINPMLSDIQQDTLVEHKENRSGVTCLDTYDVTGDGKVELLVGKRDGSIHIYTLMEDNDIDIGSALIFKGKYGESISAIKGGCVRQNGYIEVIAITYTGLVFGLTTQVIPQSMSESRLEAMNLEQDTNILHTDNEFEELGRRLAAERQRAPLISPGETSASGLHINDVFTLNKDEASYDLSIEIPLPIESVHFRCDCPIEVQNKDGMVFGEIQPLEGIYLAATYIPKILTLRADFNFRAVEGQNGTLQMMITPRNSPGVIEMREYQIKPLSLHMRVHKEITELRPFNTLSLKGSFSQAEIHSWLNNCVPEMPERIHVGDNSSFVFRHVFATTILIVEYGKGMAEFKSDNLSTISILKEYLTKEATKKRIRLEISQNINDQSVPHVIKIFEPQLMANVVLKEDHKLLEALLELDLTTEEEFNILSPEYQNILNNQDAIMKAFTKNPPIINRIFGFLTDLFIDRYKFKGINVKNRIPSLIKLLEEYQYDAVIDFFLGGNKSNESSMENA